MSTPIHLECLSHTPVHGYFDPAPEVVAEVERVWHTARERVEAFDPELIVMFAPDHFNGFFYDLMPPFCIGTHASAVGDYNTPSGALSVPSDLALRLVESVLAADIDVAHSHRMQVDHACAQALKVLVGGLDRRPVIPIFINSVAPPMASLRRSRLLGDAIGRFLLHTGKRVLVVGSGGLSHEPPLPELRDAPPEVAERLIAGHHQTPESRAVRQANVVAAAQAFAEGRSTLHPINPTWDREFLAHLESGELTAVDGMTNEAITRDGGRSAHEIRTWVAAFGALAAYGRYRTSLDYYRAIPEWMTGIAAMHATPAVAIAAVV